MQSGGYAGQPSADGRGSIVLTTEPQGKRTSGAMLLQSISESGPISDPLAEPASSSDQKGERGSLMRGSSLFSVDSVSSIASSRSVSSIAATRSERSRLGFDYWLKHRKRSLACPHTMPTYMCV